MPRVVKVVAAGAAILLLPSLVFAQATIAGVVRDTSAAVLPGVTVEASSPALIEKARSVVSDGTASRRVESWTMRKIRPRRVGVSSFFATMWSRRYSVMKPVC